MIKQNFPRRRLATILLWLMVVPLLAIAAEGPIWWETREVVTGSSPKDFAPATQGQLKKMASAAMAEMGNIPGGASASIHAVVDPWSANTSLAKDYSMVTLGQLKAVAKPFYDQLISSNLAEQYPWTPETEDDNDYAPATIGQLKRVFNFLKAVRPGFNTRHLIRNDDGYAFDLSGHTYTDDELDSVAPHPEVNWIPDSEEIPRQVPLGFSNPIKYGDKSVSYVYINNNGNVTIDAPLTTYTPKLIEESQASIIAPFWADGDTRDLGTSKVTYGTGNVEVTSGVFRPAFGVNWLKVDYFTYSAGVTPAIRPQYNYFQLIIIDRNDRDLGDFDMEFNYDQIHWETGSSNQSDGKDGFGGNSAAVGFAIKDASNAKFVGSAVNSAFLDYFVTSEEAEDGFHYILTSTVNPTGLVYHKRGSTQLGRYVFSFHNGALLDKPGIALSVSPSSPSVSGGAALTATLTNLTSSNSYTYVWREVDVSGDATITPGSESPVTGIVAGNATATASVSFINSGSRLFQFVISDGFLEFSEFISLTVLP